jgi:hypothetical protein
MWIMSLPCIVANLRHAVEAGYEVQEPYAFTLPAVRATMEELVLEIAKQAGTDPAKVDYAPDALLEESFGRLPPLEAASARALGFRDDGSLSALVGAALDHAGRGE